MVTLSALSRPVNASRFGTPPTFTEALGQSRSKAVRELHYTPDQPHAGTAEIVTTRTRGGKAASDLYRVEEFAADRRGFDGRAFLFTKADGETRYVFLCRKGNHSCDCEGFTYQSKQRADRVHRLMGEKSPVGESLGCKHLDAARALVENRWIKLPAVRVVTLPELPIGADGDLPNPLDSACDWCAGTNAIPDGNGQLYPCPICCPHGVGAPLTAAGPHAFPSQSSPRVPSGPRPYRGTHVVRLNINSNDGRDREALRIIRIEARRLAWRLPTGFDLDDLESVGDEAYVLHLARGGWACPEQFWGGLSLGVRFRMRNFLNSLRVKGRANRRMPRDAFGEDIPLPDARVPDPSDIAAARELLRTFPALCGADVL